MAAAAGSLVVSLGLDAAEYTKGLTKAEYQAKQFAENIGKTIDAGVTLAISSLAGIATAGVAAFGFLDRQAENIAKFQELSDKVGDTAENIASLKAASDLSGVGFDTIAAASIKLTSSLSKLDDEGKGAGAAITALGLNFDQFKNLTPVDQIEATAKALANFEDGAGKTAVAVALFGKSGADLLPLLQDLAGEAQRNITLTADQIAASDAYTKQTARLRGELENLAQQTTAGLVPALSNIVTMLSEVLKWTKDSEVGFTLLKASLSAVTTVIETLVVIGSDVAFVLKGIGTEIGGVAAQVGALLQLDFKGFTAISDAMKDDAKRARAELDRFQATILNPQQKVAEVAAVAVTKPKINTSGLVTKSGGSKDDPAKAILDNQLKALENMVKEEEDLLRSRNKMLDLYNGENLLSTQAYFEGKRVAQSAALSSQIALYDHEIAALQKYQAASGKATEREAAQGKINDLLEKKKRLTREAGETAIEWGFKERRAVEDLGRQINSVNADVLELTGNLGAAARIRVEDQYGDLSKRLGAEGNTAALEQVNRLKQLKIAQADYGQQTELVSQITESLRIQEERIGLSRQLGADGELSSLVKLGQARSGALAQMTALVEAQEAIARASNNPALILNAERSRLELDKLAAVADPLANKFDEIFTGSLGNAFGEFINGTKSAKDAFKDFTSSVLGQVGNLVAQNIAKQLFGSLFGGSTGGASSFGSFFSAIFGGGKAAGGSVMPNTMYRVNENGPELLDVNGKQYLMNGSRNARITPNDQIGNGSGYTQNLTYVVEGRIDRSTQSQLANKVRRETNAAAARFA